MTSLINQLEAALAAVKAAVRARDDTALDVVRDAQIEAACHGCKPEPYTTLLEGLAEIGRLLAWAKRPKVGPYSAAEVASMLRVSTQKIYDDCKAGLIAHEKHPIRISDSALAEYSGQRQRQGFKTTGFRHLH